MFRVILLTILLTLLSGCTGAIILIGEYYQQKEHNQRVEQRYTLVEKAGKKVNILK